MKLTLLFGFAAAGMLCAQPEHVMVRSGGVIATAPTAGMHMERMSLSPVKGAPYSADAVTESVQTLADGNRITNRQTSKTWRDSEGRTRMEHEMRTVGPWVASGDGMTIVMIDDPVAKEHITLNPATKTATRLSVTTHAFAGNTVFFNREIVPHSAGAGQTVHVQVEKAVVNAAEGSGAEPKKDVMMWKQEGGPEIVIKHAPADVKKTSLGKQMMEGVEVEGTREFMTIPAGDMGNERPIEVVTERWVSTALQIDILRKHNDPRFGETTYKLTGLSRSEPARSLFEIPADYKVENPVQEIKIQKKETK